jgi:5-methylcytosine-specific restriction endonuclease McrA
MPALTPEGLSDEEVTALDDMRWCRTGHFAPVAEMVRNRSMPGWVDTICRPCAAARVRAARKARVAEGRCEKAGCKNNAASGRTYCAKHLAAERERARARVAAYVADGRNAAAKRAWRKRNVAQGYCRNGPGHGPAIPGTTKCARCRARAQARYRKTLIEYTAILADQGVDHDGRCELCGLAEATQVDHVIPKSRDGGDEDPLLLRWVCRTCNASRGNNTDWTPALTAWDIDEALSREEG